MNERGEHETEANISDDQLRSLISKLIELDKYGDDVIPTMTANFIVHGHIDGPQVLSVGDASGHPSFQILVDRAKRLLEIMKRIN